MRETTRKAREDGYVECTECGHLVEHHDRTGCHGVEGCTCPARWTQAQIRELRKSLGLPARFKPSDLG